MKKVIIITGMMMFLASNVFATTLATYAQGSVPSGLTGFAASKSVIVAYESTATTGTYFACSAKHTNGDKIFGAISTQTSVYSKQDNQGDTLATGDNPTLPTTSTGSINSGWTAM